MCSRARRFCSAPSPHPPGCCESGRNTALARCEYSNGLPAALRLKQTVAANRSVHTAIIDECGCTPESSVGLLLRMHLRNLILVGDHKQLPPTSMVPPSELDGTVSGHGFLLLRGASSRFR